MFAKLFSREQASSRGPRRSPQKGAAALGPSAHVDTFTRDSLPLRSNGPIWFSIDPSSNTLSI